MKDRRAPRLDSRTYLAPHVTRRGRFRKIDPLKARPLPSAATAVGALGWALLLAETLRRARKVHRTGS